MPVRTASAKDDDVEAFAKAILVGILYFCAATFSLELSHGLFGFAPIWPANAILLAAVLRGGGQARRYLAISAIASLAANSLAGAGWLLCAGFTVANLAEPLLARMLVRKLGLRPGAPTVSGRELALFCVVAAAAASVSAFVATLFAPDDRGIFFASWFLADFLGMLIITPIAIMAADAVNDGAWRRVPARMIEGVSLLSLVTVLTLIAFLNNRFPMLFLPLAAMMPVVVRLGTIGVSFGVVVIAAIAAIATGLGSGPVVMVHVGRLQEAMFVQVYLFALYAACLPSAALLGAQRRLLEDLRENNRMLNMAEASAQLGHWRFRASDRHLYWSSETYRIHGMDPAGPPPALDAIFDAYVEEDRARVRAIVERAIAEGSSYEFRSRIRRPDGAIRHIFARGEIDRDPNGEMISVFGMIQDCTEQSEQERALDHARIAAEEAAAAARLASETDPLTALPNRRQLLIVLDRAREQATEQRQALSVAMLDIDHFKRVNDTYGHVVGDRVIQRIAQAASSALRGTDVIGRFGGEEFIIVLPNASLDVAETIAGRVRAAIEDDVMEGFGDWPNVTASLGVAGWNRGESVTSLLQRADEALYEAKRSGRNKVCSARRPMPAGKPGAEVR
ncbi:sensor domain-containing diguanylate cyclase [Sphingomonas sp.]|uniref:sensor domain-containing diguanylate cyclase n=1 Tax=Sphingomonas sp. TaxID=28214 RepID=UPI000DB5F96E|nr:sensor domain-containing diguanylate cyclase [Sphingomonas sp.]PZU09048.1 MAG: sensor domain-containing diguanylate cyclase [Sphingomonas sp.]